MKSGRRCPGYDRDTVFLNQTGASTTRTTSLDSTTTATPGTVRATAGGSRRPRAATVRTLRQEQPEIQLATQVNNQQVFQDLFAGEFLRIYLPTANNRPRVPLAWPQLVYDIPTEGPALRLSMAAVSLLVVGSSTSNPTLSVEGSRKYGQALCELQKALWDERLMYKDETLAACNALLLYEVYPNLPVLSLIADCRYQAF